MKHQIAALLLLPLASIGADTNALPALAPPLPELPPTLSEETSAAIREHPAASLAGVLIVLALAAFVLWQIFKPRPRPVLPPAAVASEALTKLLRQPEDGKTLSEISQILRRYVAAALAWPPGEMTTAEFCAALAGNEKIGAELAQTISNFLHECDQRKFSSVGSATPLDAARRALEFVALTEKSKTGTTPVFPKNDR